MDTTISLDALRSLQEQAGHAGDWTITDYVTHIDVRSELEGIAVEVPGVEEQDWAIAKLVAVSKNHLLPLAEAVEAVPCFFECPGLESECGNDKCLRCSALKALQEALE